MIYIKKNIIFLIFAISANAISIAQPQFSADKLPFSTSVYDEFSPAFYKDGIVFCSNRKNDFLVSYSDTTDDAGKLIDLYFTSSYKDGKKWYYPMALNNGLNSLVQEGPASFYKNNEAVAFTRNIYTSKKFGNYLKSGNYLGIFFAEYVNDKWTNIVPFEYNSKTYNVMHPTLEEDGKTMYFASNMPGGIGGYDIYVTYYSSGKWSKPENLGPNVNSDNDEAFPFIHSSGRLFFASKGWKSKGGFDIFFTQQFGDKWITPQNMKEPINSVYDDFGLIADEYLQSGYFSSHRNGTDDIYSFKSTITGFENCKKQRKNNFCYVFYENGTSANDVQAGMKYEWDLGDGTKIRALEAHHCFAKTGKYQVKLNVIDSITGEVLLNQAQYDFDVEEIEQPFINIQDVAYEGETVKLDAKNTNLKNFRIAKYQWDFDDGLRSSGLETSHIYYNEGVYDVKLQVESTDGRNGVQRQCVFKSIAVKKREN